MDLTHQLLAPIFEKIGNLLASTPGQLEQFETWANAQSLRLRRAADQGMTTLAYEAEMLRTQLASLKSPAGPLLPMQACQHLWLTGLIELVDDLLEDAAPEDVPWTEESNSAADHHL